VQEHLLRQFQCFAGVAQPAHGDRVDRRLELLDKPAERVTVSVLGQQDKIGNIRPGVRPGLLPFQDHHGTHLPHQGNGPTENLRSRYRGLENAELEVGTPS